jgi:hypothetical protein
MATSLLVALAGLAILFGIGGLLLRGWGGDALLGIAALLGAAVFWLAVPW